MQFLKSHFYKICFDVGGSILTYTCEVLEDSEDFLKFKDKFGKEITYNKKNIISSEEVSNDS